MLTRSATTVLLNLLLAGLLVAPPVGAEEWPNWRGPRHDGISTEKGFKTTLAAPLKPRWEAEVGSAFSSFACVDGKLYTCGTKDEKQVLLCLAADTGKVLWETAIEKAYPDGQGGDGTRATPTVDGDRVYIFGPWGRLLCCAAASGKELWSKQYEGKPRWGYSGSVLIEGDLAVVSPGGADGALLALHKKTGETAWKCGDDKVGYATPYPFTFDGGRYITGFMDEALIIADAKTGRQVCRVPWKTDYGVNAAAPIFHDGHLFLSSGYNHGCLLVKLARQGDELEAKPVWENKAVLNKFQSCILHDGYLYTSDDKALKCVEFLTGAEAWNQSRVTHGTLVLADGQLLLLTENGELKIAPVSAKGFVPTTDIKVLEGRCWTVPVLYRGKLYVRNLKTVACHDLK